MGYDSAEELTSTTPGAGPATTYGYDDSGDRTSAIVAATESTAASTTSFTYDPAGDLASVGLPATGSTSTETVSYTSDGEGLRQSRTVGSSTKDFLWDTNASIPLLLNDGTYRYISGPSSAQIAEVNDSTGAIRYLTGDLIGSTRLITPSSGAVVGVNLYDEYGNLVQQTGTATSPIGYAGNWTDPDTGLAYMRARDYDPRTAQFLSSDPLVDTTREPYAFVADDPMNHADSTGLACDNMDLAADNNPSTDDSIWVPVTQLAANLLAIGVTLYDEDSQQVFEVASFAVPETAVLGLIALRYGFVAAIENVLDYAETGLPTTIALRFGAQSIASTITGAVRAAGSGLSTAIGRAGSAVNSIGRSVASRFRPASSSEPEPQSGEQTSSSSEDITTKEGGDDLLAETEAEEDDSAAE